MVNYFDKLPTYTIGLNQASVEKYNIILNNLKENQKKEITETIETTFNKCLKYSNEPIDKVDVIKNLEITFSVRLADAKDWFEAYSSYKNFKDVIIARSIIRKLIDYRLNILNKEKE